MIVDMINISTNLSEKRWISRYGSFLLIILIVSTIGAPTGLAALRNWYFQPVGTGLSIPATIKVLVWPVVWRGLPSGGDGGGGVWAVAGRAVGPAPQGLTGVRRDRGDFVRGNLSAVSVRRDVCLHHDCREIILFFSFWKRYWNLRKDACYQPSDLC